MTKLSDLRNASAVRAEDLADAQVRAENNRTSVAHGVAMLVLKYRTDNGLSQSALARQLGLQQPAIARIEAGDHEPTFTTLERLAAGLGIEFHIDITGTATELRQTA